MQTAITHSAAMQTVEGSPAAVAAHDKSAWLALFAGFSVIEDPVGSRPHVNGVFDARSGRRGDGAASRFYDTFIAPNTIAFDVQQDIVCDHHVVRDLEIEITMAPKVAIRVPMHLLYELCEEGDALRIRRLAAHWELLPMIRRLMTSGPRAWPVGMALGRRMYTNLGLSGTAGFVGGMRTVGDAGKEVVRRFAEASGSGNGAAMAELFGHRGAAVELACTGTSMTASEAAESGPPMSAAKLLASGFTVSASLRIGDTGRPGVGIFEFDRATGRLDRVRLYSHGPPTSAGGLASPGEA